MSRELGSCPIGGMMGIQATTIGIVPQLTFRSPAKIESMAEYDFLSMYG